MVKNRVTLSKQPVGSKRPIAIKPLSEDALHVVVGGFSLGQPPPTQKPEPGVVAPIVEPGNR